jgi:hypothetical protein
MISGKGFENTEAQAAGGGHSCGLCSQTACVFVQDDNDALGSLRALCLLHFYSHPSCRAVNRHAIRHWDADVVRVQRPKVERVSECGWSRASVY